MNATVSQKGWVVIPADLRKKYALHTGNKVQVIDYGGVLAIVPAFSDPVKQSFGLIKSKKSLTKVLLGEHWKEKKHDK